MLRKRKNSVEYKNIERRFKDLPHNYVSSFISVIFWILHWLSYTFIGVSSYSLFFAIYISRIKIQQAQLKILLKTKLVFLIFTTTTDIITF